MKKMRVIVSSFCMPKIGNTLDENDDAFYLESDGEQQGEILRFAIADGATTSLLSGKWADILVKVFCESDRDPVDIEDLLECAYAPWEDRKAGYLKDREKRNKPIQWYEEPGLQAGAFSTFLGLTLRTPQGASPGSWEAIALGDSCLVQVINGEVTPFPVEHSSDFNNQPVLISSNPDRNEGISDQVYKKTSNFGIGDRFFLMTDALACWFLCEYENTRKMPRQVQCPLDSDDERKEFKEQIHKLIDEKQMRNDDVTLIRIDVNRHKNDNV